MLCGQTAHEHPRAAGAQAAYFAAAAPALLVHRPGMAVRDFAPALVQALLGMEQNDAVEISSKRTGKKTKNL
jgi:hypothetical protein